MLTLADKYIYKGPDQASVRAMGIWNRDEIAVYENMRYFGAAEACWRLFSFKLFSMQPSVERLDCHMDDQMRVRFQTGAEQVVGTQEPPQTSLLAWLEYCRSPQEYDNRPLPPDWEGLTYLQFPGFFVLNARGLPGWSPRSRHGSTRYRAVGRLPPVSIQDEERFYLRLLLCSITCGEVSLLVQHPVRVTQLRGAAATFKEACMDRGLASDDREWEHALAEARSEGMPQAIRQLFVYIVVFNSPMRPVDLFEQNWYAMYDSRREPYSEVSMHARRLNVDRDVLNRLLMICDMREALEGAGCSDAHSHLPSISDADQLLLDSIHQYEQQPRVVRVQLAYDVAAESTACEQKTECLQSSQLQAYTTVKERYDGQGDGVFFIDAPAGAGKTFLIQCLLHMVRAAGHVALAVATTGITALELDGGGTLHSMLKAPMTTSPGCRLNIDARSAHATLIRLARIMIYEEAAFHDKEYLEAVDLTFRDIRGDSRPFGGIMLVMAGDL